MRETPVCSAEDAMRIMAERNHLTYTPNGDGKRLVVDNDGTWIQVTLDKDGRIAAGQ